MSYIDLNSKDYFTPIQEEVSTDRREKSDLDLKLNKKEFEENNPHNTVNDLQIETNNSSSNIGKHSKRYSIDACEKVKFKDNTLPDKKSKDDVSISSKRDSENNKVNETFKTKINKFSTQINERIRVKKLELFNNYHTIEAERDISIEPSKESKFNFANQFMMNTPKIGNSAGVKEKNEFNLYFEKKIKFALESRKKETLIGQNKNPINITTFNVRD